MHHRNCNRFLGFLPADVKTLTTTRFEAYFINDARWAQVYCWAWDKDNPYINYTGVQWRTEYKVGTLPYISGNPVKPLGYAECTPVHQKRLNFPYNSFQLCLD